MISSLIAGKESGQVEFKETTGQLERGMETLCAFLNGEGGTVVFGVTDKGKIIGQEVSDKTKRDIGEAINRLEPDRKSTRLNSSHSARSRMPSSA